MKAKKDLIIAVQWYYGMTKKETIEYIKIADKTILESIYLCYMNEMNKAFYND